jgi:Holliday junction resolvasome RuvABC endonuclease subunit
MKVIGLDTSLTGTGIASSAGWCERVGREGVTKLPLAQRVEAVDDLVDRILFTAGEADLWVIELPAFSRSGGGAVERHALWWLLVRRLTRGIGAGDLVTVAPNLRALYATGKGGAAKSAVNDAVARRLPQFETNGDDNLCDAVVLCAMGCDWLGAPLALMPSSHRVALNKITWPEVPDA